MPRLMQKGILQYIFPLLGQSDYCDKISIASICLKEKFFNEIIGFYGFYSRHWEIFVKFIIIKTKNYSLWKSMTIHLF